MNQLEVEALEDEIEHYQQECEDAWAFADSFSRALQRQRQELRDTREKLRDIRENVMVALVELRSLPGAEAAVRCLRRSLVHELNEGGAGTEAPAPPTTTGLEDAQSGIHAEPNKAQDIEADMNNYVQ